MIMVNESGRGKPDEVWVWPGSATGMFFSRNQTSIKSDNSSNLQVLLVTMILSRSLTQSIDACKLHWYREDEQ